MTTILATFLFSLILSLALTPVAGRLGAKFGALDVPDERKVHTKPVPRTGGAAIFIAFLLALAISTFFKTNVSKLLVMDRQTTFLLAGAIISFGVGLVDDFRRLSPKVKFLFQIMAASLAFWGGIRVGHFHTVGVLFEIDLLSYFLTVFWFVLFMNAVNLVDGLDGLAGGIAVFASVVMVILSSLKGNLLTAMLFAALGGGVLGFLRYNFNPASIFLGDGGSYFLGYVIAGLSITGSVKTQLGAAVLIPVLALGIPLFDTILSTIRRFIRGRKMFFPDKGHIHHRLLGMGIGTEKVVWLIYLMTLCLCLMAVVLVNLEDERAGLFLIVLGAGAVIFVRKLGYFGHLGPDNIYNWFKDVSDEVGFSLDRRSFLDLQIDISGSKNLKELWNNTIRVMEMLEFDLAALYLNGSSKRDASRLVISNDWDHVERRETSAFMSSVSMRKKPPDLSWFREPFDLTNNVCSRCLLRLEMHLLGADNTNFGTLVLLKDLNRKSMNQYTLKRVEHLRRTIIKTIEQLEKDSIPKESHVPVPPMPADAVERAGKDSLFPRQAGSAKSFH